MILTAHQPVYLPWLGLFHKIALAEQFCIFDIAQYQTKDFNNRNKIKTNVGALWLSVPVESKNHYDKVIKDVRIIRNGWERKQIKSIRLAYDKAAHFSDYFPELERLLMKNHEFLTELNTDLLRLFLRLLAIDRPLVVASDYDFSGRKSELVLDMCVKLGAQHYIFGAQGRDYADTDAFDAAGIKAHFQDYRHPSYRQLHGDFLPYMSIIDLLFNEGSRSYGILMSGNCSSVLSA
jgi:hypothetical protein